MQQLQRTTRKRFQQQTRVTNQQPALLDERSNILTSLAKFASAGSEFANVELQKKIEADKITQANRAAEDLLRTTEERQGITEDSTKAGQLAYNMVVGKHDTMEAGNKFVEWYQQNLDADEDTIAAEREKLYQPLLDKYGTDPQTLKAISLQVQESQFTLAQIQNKMQGEHKYAKATEAYGIAMNDFLDDPNADMEKVKVNLADTARSLGINEFDAKKSLLQTAFDRASNGDNRMIDMLRKEPWAKNNPILDKAQKAYDERRAQNAATELGTEMGSLELNLLSGNMSWDAGMKKIESINSRYPDTYTPERVASLKKQFDTKTVERNTASEGLQDSLKVFTDSSAIPLAHNDKYTEKDRNAIIKGMDSYWAKMTKDLTAAYGQDKAIVAVQDHKLKWSRLNRMPVPSLKTSIESMINLNPDEIQAGEFPVYAKSGMSLIKKMDESALEIYLPTEGDRVFAQNFKTFALEMSDEHAYRKAMRIKTNPFKASTEKLTEQRERVVSVVDEALTDLDSDVPEWQRELLASDWQRGATLRMQGGGTDTKANAESVVRSNLSRMTQLSNGTLANIATGDLSVKIARGRPMGKGKETLYVQKFIDAIKPDMEAAYGEAIEEGNYRLNFNRTGDTFTVITSDGTQLGGVFATEDIYSFGRKFEESEAERIQKQEAESSEYWQGVTERARNTNLEGLFPRMY